MHFLSEKSPFTPMSSVSREDHSTLQMKILRPREVKVTCEEEVELD